MSDEIYSGIAVTMQYTKTFSTIRVAIWLYVGLNLYSSLLDSAKILSTSYHFLAL